MAGECGGARGGVEGVRRAEVGLPRARTRGHHNTEGKGTPPERPVGMTIRLRGGGSPLPGWTGPKNQGRYFGGGVPGVWGGRARAEREGGTW